MWTNNGSATCLKLGTKVCAWQMATHMRTRFYRPKYDHGAASKPACAMQAREHALRLAAWQAWSTETWAGVLHITAASRT